MNVIQYNPLLDGTAYVWGNITCNILGRNVIGITKIAYDEKQAMVNNYGAGGMPISRGYGNIESAASITLTMEEVRAIETLAGGRIMNIPAFDIVVTYLSGVIIVTDILKNAQFTNNKVDVKQNDMQIESEFELIISHIEKSA